MTDEWFVMYITNHNIANHSSVILYIVMVDNIAYHNETNHSSVKLYIIMIDNITNHSSVIL
jgi:hypothetical protein